MTHQEIAKEYLRCFCAGNIAGLEPLLASRLKFTGTLQTCHSAREYLDSLRSDPPEACDYKVLSITESDQHVALFYEYLKPKGTIQIAQLFKIVNERIEEVLLIFDSRSLG